MAGRNPHEHVRAALRRHGIDLTGEELTPAVDAYVETSTRLDLLRAVLDTGDGYR